MHSLANDAGGIATARLFVAVVSLILQLRRFIRRDGELKTPRVVADYIYRPDRQISAWDCRKEVNERDSIVHRIPEAPVLVEIWVVAPVAVEQEVGAWLKGVAVGAPGRCRY